MSCLSFIHRKRWWKSTRRVWFLNWKKSVSLLQTCFHRQKWTMKREMLSVWSFLIRLFPKEEKKKSWICWTMYSGIVFIWMLISGLHIKKTRVREAENMTSRGFSRKLMQSLNGARNREANMRSESLLWRQRRSHPNQEARLPEKRKQRLQGNLLQEMHPFRAERKSSKRRNSARRIMCVRWRSETIRTWSTERILKMSQSNWNRLFLRWVRSQFMVRLSILIHERSEMRRRSLSLLWLILRIQSRSRCLPEMISYRRFSEIWRKVLSLKSKAWRQLINSTVSWQLVQLPESRRLETLRSQGKISIQRNV